MELLDHPVVSSLIQDKWRRFGKALFAVFLVFYALQPIFLTAFALVIPNPLTVDCFSK